MMAPSESDSPRERIIEYLDQEVTGGRAFIKSHHIASKLDLSAKEIGMQIQSLEAHSSGFRIRRWGGDSNGTTWVIDRSPTDS